MKQAAEAQAEQERQAEQKQAYVDLLKEQANLEEEIAKAEENVRLEQERMDNMSGWDHFWTGGEWDDLEAYPVSYTHLSARPAPYPLRPSRLLSSFPLRRSCPPAHRPPRRSP